MKNMKNTPQKFLHTLFLLLIFSIPFQLFGQIDCGQITADMNVNEITTVCEGTPITVLNDSDSDFTFFVWDWGDGIRDTVFNANSNLHTYDVSDSQACGGVGENYEIKLEIHLECPSGTSYHSNSSPVYVIYKPRARINAEDTGCQNEPVNFANNSCNGETYLWNFGNGETSTEVSPTYAYSNPGEYTVTLTATNGCGSHSSTHEIEIIGFPVAASTLDLEPESGCTDLVIDVSNQSQWGTSYEWSVSPNNGFSYLEETDENSFEPSFLFFNDGIYTITLTTSNICGEHQWSQTIDVFQAPTVSLAPVPPGCDMLSFIPNVSYTGTIDNVSWSFPGGSPSSSNNLEPGEVTYSTPGNYTASVTISSICGDDTTEIPITVQSFAQIDIAPVPLLCTGSDTVSLSASPEGGTWSGTGISSAGLVNPASLSAGNYTFTYTYGTGDCQIQEQINVQVEESAAINAGNDFQICIESAATTLNGQDPTGGVWSGLGITDTDLGIFDPETAGLGIHDLTYSLTNAAGCVTTDGLSIEVLDLPTFSIEQDIVSVCDSPEDIDLNDYLTTTVQPSGGNFIWSGGGITNVSSGIFNSNAAGGIGTYTVYVDYEIITDCFVSDSLQIEVTAVEEAVVVPDTTVCINIGTLTLEGTPAGGIWSGANIDANSGVINLTAFSGGGNTSQTYTYTVFAGTTCERSDEVIVSIIDFSNLNAGNDVGFCETETIVSLPTASPAGGVWSGEGITNTTTGEVDIQQLSPGTYEMTYAIDDPSIDCTAEDILILTVYPIPTALFSFGDLACVNTSIPFVNESIGGQTYSWNFGDNSTSNQVNPNHIFTENGDYNVTLVVTSQFGCVHEYSQVLHVTSPPDVVAYTIDTDEGCADLTVAFTNNSIGEDLSYVWDFGNGTTSIEEQPAPIIFTQGLTDTTYHIVLGVANGCGDETFQDSVLVHPQPMSNFGSDFNAYCSGDTVYFANISAGDPDSYFWDYGNGVTSNDSVPVPQVYFTDTLITPTVTLITQNECGIDTMEISIVIQPTNVEAFFNTDNTTFCVGDTVQFTNFATLGSSVSWNFGDGNLSNQSNPSHIFLNAGTYTVTQYATGCGFDSTNVVINVLPLPTAAFTYDAINCIYDTVHFVNNSQDNIASEWDFGNGMSSFLENPIHAFNTGGANPVTLTVTSENGCQHSELQLVEIIQPPIPMPVFADSICVGESINFENTNTDGVSSCSWDFGNGLLLNDCTVEFSYDNAGDYLIALEITDDFGCKDTTANQVYVRPTPIPDFNFTILNDCNPATVVFENTSIDANGFSWNFGEGNTSIEENPEHIFTEGGNFPITISANYDNICTNSITQNVLIHPTPEAAFNPIDAAGCAPYDANFLNISSGELTTIHWTFGDGLYSYDASPSHLFESPGSYEVNLYVTTEWCNDSVSGTVIVHPPVVTESTSENILCHGAATGSIDLSIVGGTEEFSYTWSNGSENEDLIGLTAGEYTYTVTDANACIDTDTIVLTQPNALDIFISEEEIVTCFGGSDGALFIEGSGGVESYNFTWEDGTIGNFLSNASAGLYSVSLTDSNECLYVETVELHENQAINWQSDIQQISCFGADDGFIGIREINGGVGPYYSNLSSSTIDIDGGSFPNLLQDEYTLYISDSLACEFYDTINIIEPTEIWVEIGEKDQQILLGDVVDLSTDYNADNPSFSWTPSSWLDCSNCSNPVTQPWETVLYVVKMTDDKGCEARDSIEIEVEIQRSVFIPTAFTPNGDGNNDVFTIRSGDQSIKTIKLFGVYDRWGELMFETEDFLPNDTAYAWDGKFKGREADAGVYTWYAEVEFVDNLVEVYQGDITLIK